MPSPAATGLIGADPAPLLQIELIDSTLGDVPLETLMAVARRDNPKRALLVVSRLLGKHLNVVPNIAVAAGTALGELVAAALGRSCRLDALDALASALRSGGIPPLSKQVADQGPPAIVLAYAETATALGHLVRRALGPGPMLHTTRALPPAGALLAFAESHSHASEHLLFHDDRRVLAPPVPVVLVDDELTTGQTVMNTIAAIQRIAPRHRYLIATLLDWRLEVRREEFSRFSARHEVEVEVVSLASGTASVLDRPQRCLPERATELNETPFDPGIEPIRLSIRARPTARNGWTEVEQVEVEEALAGAAALLQRRRSGPRALVLGTEELMYVPLLLAAHLDGEIQVRSTTRSPILTSSEPGYPIVEGLSFRANDDTAGRRYLYNLGLDQVDDVFLCCEDAAAYCKSTLLRALMRRHHNVHLVELVP